MREAHIRCALQAVNCTGYMPAMSSPCELVSYLLNLLKVCLQALQNSVQQNCVISSPLPPSPRLPLFCFLCLEPAAFSSISLSLSLSISLSHTRALSPVRCHCTLLLAQRCSYNDADTMTPAQRRSHNDTMTLTQRPHNDAHTMTLAPQPHNDTCTPAALLSSWLGRLRSRSRTWQWGWRTDPTTLL